MREIRELRLAVVGEVFDYQTLMHALREYKKPRDKATQLLASGAILRIKKGVYAFGEEYRKTPLSLEVIAALLVQPSYISREYALGKYGLFPEKVHIVTSMTTRKKKEFDTSVGVFEYRSISPARFSIGVEVKEIPGQGGYLCATKEKALADWIASVPRILNTQELRFFLFEESRIDESALFPLKKKLLKEIAKIYKNHNVFELTKL